MFQDGSNHQPAIYHNFSHVFFQSMGHQTTHHQAAASSGDWILAFQKPRNRCVVTDVGFRFHWCVFFNGAVRWNYFRVCVFIVSSDLTTYFAKKTKKMTWHISIKKNAENKQTMFSATPKNRIETKKPKIAQDDHHILVRCTSAPCLVHRARLRPRRSQKRWARWGSLAGPSPYRLPPAQCLPWRYGIVMGWKDGMMEWWWDSYGMIYDTYVETIMG